MNTMDKSISLKWQSLWKKDAKAHTTECIFWKIIYFQSKINDMLPYKKCKKRGDAKTLTAEKSVEQQVALGWRTAQIVQE